MNHEKIFRNSEYFYLQKTSIFQVGGDLNKTNQEIGPEHPDS